MKQRPCIVVFAGKRVKASAELYRMQLDAREDLVSCVGLGGKEGTAEIQNAMSSALNRFTAENLESLAARGLLSSTDLQEIPVLVALHGADAPLLRASASALIEAAASYPNLHAKLRFTTLAISEAELRAARKLANELVRALDDIGTSDGVAFQNTVLVLCKEIRGAPISDDSVAPILARLALVLTTFDYDPEKSEFSRFWNHNLAGSGHIYFVGIASYKIQRLRGWARKCLLKELGTRLLELLRKNPTSLWPNLELDTLASFVLKALSNTGDGRALTAGSAQWADLADRYRKHVVPTLLQELLPKVRSIDQLRSVIEVVQKHVRVEPARRDGTSSASHSLGIALPAVLLPGDTRAIFFLVAALIGGSLSFLAWKSRKKPADPVVPSSPRPQPIPESPVFAAVIEELLDQLATPEDQYPLDEQSAEHASGVNPELGTATPQAKLPFCEVVFDPDQSTRARDAARDAAVEAGQDTLRLLLMTKLRHGKWLRPELAADLINIERQAVRKIEEAALADFNESAERTEKERGGAGSIQQVLFAPTLQIDLYHAFLFRGRGPKAPSDPAETCAVPNTLTFLYLVSQQ